VAPDGRATRDALDRATAVVVACPIAIRPVATLGGNGVRYRFRGAGGLIVFPEPHCAGERHTPLMMRRRLEIREGQCARFRA